MQKDLIIFTEVLKYNNSIKKSHKYCNECLKLRPIKKLRKRDNKFYCFKCYILKMNLIRLPFRVKDYDLNYNKNIPKIIKEGKI